MSKKTTLREREDIRDEVGGVEEEAHSWRRLKGSHGVSAHHGDVKGRHATRGIYRPCDRIRANNRRNQKNGRVLEKRKKKKERVLNHQR